MAAGERKKGKKGKNKPAKFSLGYKMRGRQIRRERFSLSPSDQDDHKARAKVLIFSSKNTARDEKKGAPISSLVFDAFLSLSNFPMTNGQKYRRGKYF